MPSELEPLVTFSTLIKGDKNNYRDQNGRPFWRIYVEIVFIVEKLALEQIQGQVAADV